MVNDCEICFNFTIEIHYYKNIESELIFLYAKLKETDFKHISGASKYFRNIGRTRRIGQCP